MPSTTCFIFQANLRFKFLNSRCARVQIVKKLRVWLPEVSEIRLSSIWKMTNLLVEQIIVNCRIIETQVIEKCSGILLPHELF